MTNLRKGKTKTTLQSSIDSALLAVEIYNKPRTTFRSEGFIVLMVIAWTRLFHAHFNTSIGDRYYYKKKGSYELIDGERKSWELGTCIRKYGSLSEPIEKNLEFFTKLRNKIEHRHINKREVDALIFGECQALLYNYENLLIHLFGAHYAINEALVYSLQFSHLRTPQQKMANKASFELRHAVDALRYAQHILPVPKSCPPLHACHAFHSPALATMAHMASMDGFAPPARPPHGTKLAASNADQPSG